MTFSDGNNKVEFSVTAREDLPTCIALFSNRHGAYHRLTNLKDKLNSPETNRQEWEEWSATMEKYGLWKDDTPVAMKADGARACLLLLLRQTVTFLDRHKTTLSEIKPDSVTASYAAVMPKASEKTEQERIIFRRLWISRHDRFVPALLHTTLRRNVCHFLKQPADKEPLATPMMEPYRQIFRLLQPDLLKIGFIKIHEDDHVITFSNGTTRVEFTVTDRHYHPALAGYLINRQGDHFSLSGLRDRLNSPVTKKKEFDAWKALNEKYGLWDSSTPKAMRDKGYRACVSLDMKQTIAFLKNHQTTLTEFRSDDGHD